MTTQSKRSALTLLLILFSIVACNEEVTEVGSRGIATKDLSAEIHITNNQNKIIDVEVMLRSGNIETGIDVYLDSGDQLFSSPTRDVSIIEIGDNQFQDLNNSVPNSNLLKLASGKSSAFFKSHRKWYYTQFPINQLDQEFTVMLKRRDNLDALSSTASFPADFTILSPATGESLSRSEDINISWDSFSSQDMIQVTANLTCSNGTTQEWRTDEIINSTGVLTIPANTFLSYIGSCSLSIRIDRRNLGQLDPVFTRGGIIIGHQLRTVVIATLP